MFIERFFNPQIQNANEFVFYNTKKAVDHCISNYSCIRHYSFRGNQYIKYNGKSLIWNDGSIVDKRKLPRNDGWGKYYSEIYNHQSF
jgi:hypothetical protein